MRVVKRWKLRELDRLAEMYWMGYTNTEIADEFGCGVQRVKDALSNYDISQRYMASFRRRMSIEAKRVPKQYRTPTPLRGMKCPTPEPKSRELEYMDAIEHRLCLWMDGNLKSCGHERARGYVYCQHHHERSLKKHECKTGN